MLPGILGGGLLHKRTVFLQQVFCPDDLAVEISLHLPGIFVVRRQGYVEIDVYKRQSIILCSGCIVHLPDHKALNKALDANFSGVGIARHINDPSLFFQQQTPQVCHQHLFDHILQITTGKCCQCPTKLLHYAFSSLPFATSIIEQMF